MNEPSSTILVFALAALWVAAGFYFMIVRRGQRSRPWLGTSLILGGIAA